MTDGKVLVVVCTLSFFICSLKSWSISFAFVSSPIVVRFSMSLVLRDSGSIEIAIPFNHLHDPQPRTEPYVTPGITYESSSHNSSVKLFLNPP